RGALLDHVASCDACHALLADSMGTASDEPVRFGRYEMQRAVAGGGMGTVFRAFDPVLHRHVAIKIIADVEHDEEHRAQMLREARALASLRHENVVAIHDVGIVEDELFLAMEFVEGTSLALAVHRFPDTAARLAVLSDLTRGLEAIHAARLVHRDVKPSNVIVTPAGRAILLDLGLATPHDAAPEAAGSPGYVAPEVLAGQPATAASDQFAWWRVASEVLAPAPLPHRQRDALDRAIARGTAATPAERYPSIAAAFAAVRDILAPRRRSRLWIGGAIAGLVATGAVGWTVHSSRTRAAACSQLDGWDAATRAELGPIIGTAGFDETRVLTAIDDHAAQIHERLASACGKSSIESDREKLCLNVVWREHVREIRRIARNASRDTVAEAIDDLAGILPAARCSDGNPPAQAPTATTAQLATLEELYAKIDAASSHQGAPTVAALDALRPAVDANGYVGLSLAWSSALVRELKFAGDYVRARKELEAARHLAQTSGADAQLAWLTIMRLRLATVTKTATDELEADLDAIITRVGNPLLTAEALQARAERAYADGKPARAVELMTTAIELYTKVSLIPAPGLRSAHTMRAAALQQLGKLDEAQPDLDRAVEIARQRYAVDSVEVAEVVGARANNLLHLGKIGEAAAAFREVRAQLSAAHRDRTSFAARIDLGLCQLEMSQRTPRALAACEAAVANGEAVFGADSVKVISARSALAQYLMSTDMRRAIDVLEQTLRIGANGGDEPLDVPYAQALLAVAYNQVKRHADGCPLAERALVVLRRSPQRDIVRLLDQKFPELANGGRCR
ncbi:MAG TPA: protein kinase, partial [Kofleriaceae bacterium]|nr:protein kinase [Kofleriaceae bacterium]